MFDPGEEVQGQSQVEGLFRGSDPVGGRGVHLLAAQTDVLQGGSKGRGAHIA